MATIAEFSIPADSFTLAQALYEFPDTAVEADRIVSHSMNSTMPCFWAAEGDTSGFTEAVAADPSVEAVHATESFDQECLYHVEWSTDFKELVREMIDHEGVILEASGQKDTWLLRIRFMTRSQFETFRDHFEERIPGLQLTQLFPLTYPRHTRGDVSVEQFEALTTASDMGYFDVPREASIRDVADELGVSHQAVSERLRRGTDNFVQDMLTVAPIRDRV